MRVEWFTEFKWYVHSLLLPTHWNCPFLHENNEFFHLIFLRQNHYAKDKCYYITPRICYRIEKSRVDINSFFQ